MAVTTRSGIGLVLLTCLSSLTAQYGAENGEWRFYGGDGGDTKYAALDQINRDNVKNLRVAWKWNAENSSSRPDHNHEATPIMIDGVLYISTGASEAAAIDAATGKTIWLFTPENAEALGRRPGGSGRGVAYWTDGEDERIFHSTVDGRLFALNAKTGEPCADFGENGQVNLSTDLDGKETRARCVSPPIVSNDVVVAQFIPSGGGATRVTPGDIRGYDPRTGERLWIFHVVPRQGEFGVETWENDSWEYSGMAGVWTLLTVDEELGYVYLPTEASTNDWYGGHRLGDNLFAESLVCLDIKTGERVWHYQLVHHGIWDYDNPAPPNLLDVSIGGERVKAVALVTKQGFCYVFNRETGEPLWPIVEFPVPQTDVPGERTSPTQPIPTKPAPFEPQGFTVDNLIDLTAEIRAEAMAIAANYRMGPLYTPPSLVDDPDGTRGTLALPGWGGGASWPGAAVDAEEGIIFIPSMTGSVVLAMARGNPDRTDFNYTRTGNIYPPGPRGLPLVKPPWGRITAIDLNTGEHVWMVPNGGAPEAVRNHPDLQGLGLDFSKMGQNGRPGALVTKTLLFVGEGGGTRGGAASRHGAGGPMFRAYDKQTGEIIASVRLPGNPTGSPMTYMHDGVQYICVAVATRETPSALIALAVR